MARREGKCWEGEGSGWKYCGFSVQAKGLYWALESEGMIKGCSEVSLDTTNTINGACKDLWISTLLEQ